LPFVNKDFPEKWQRQMYTQYVQGAPTAVDTFMFLTGLLMAMSFLKVYNKPRTKFNIIIYYIHRYLRLTPALAVVYFLHVSVFLHLGDGPLWKYVTERTRENCLNRWASFFFYYQNYLDHNNMCLLHTWYLSMDMQIYIVSPLVLLPLVRRRKLMMRAGLPMLIFLSMACPFLITYFYETEIFTEDYYKYYYYPTHTRLSPWLIGTLTGAILHVYKDAKLTIHPIINIFIWAVVVSGMVACILTWTDVTYNYDRLSTSFYLTLYKPAWCCGLAWIVYACMKGRGGIFNYVLSAEIFQTLSKITYAMYLVHITCLLHNVARTRYPAHFGDLEVFHSFLGDVLMTITLAFIWCLLFESPIIAVERFIFGGGTRRKENKTSTPAIQEGEVNPRSIEEVKIEDGISVQGPPAIKTHMDPLGIEEETSMPTYSENRLRTIANNEDDILPEVLVENNSIYSNFVDTYPMYDEIKENNETLPEERIENDILISTENAKLEQNEGDNAEDDQIKPIENLTLQESDFANDNNENDDLPEVIIENNSINSNLVDASPLYHEIMQNNETLPEERIENDISDPLQESDAEIDKTVSIDVDEQNKHQEGNASSAESENKNSEILTEAKSESATEDVKNEDYYPTPKIDSKMPAEDLTTENDETLVNLESNYGKVDENLEKPTENDENDSSRKY
ncbi:Acyltransferase, partial [Oryctes borbonicus]